MRFQPSRFWPLLATVLLFLGYACSVQVAKKVSYNFPYQTRIENVDKDRCLDGFSGKVIDVGSKLEDGLYSLVGTKVSVEKQEEVGQAFHQELLKTATVVEDARTENLQRMLAKMKPYVYRKDIDYQVFLLEDSVLNAWTVPGGNVYFTTRLLDFVETDDEVAFILGHEIGHNENQ
ncbi:MAG: M48 family metallopeptidase, partial [Bacteroidota bacterium]